MGREGKNGQATFGGEVWGVRDGLEGGVGVRSNGA